MRRQANGVSSAWSGFSYGCAYRIMRIIYLISHPPKPPASPPLPQYECAPPIRPLGFALPSVWLLTLWQNVTDSSKKRGNRCHTIRTRHAASNVPSDTISDIIIGRFSRFVSSWDTIISVHSWTTAEPKKVSRSPAWTDGFVVHFQPRTLATNLTHAKTYHDGT